MQAFTDASFDEAYETLHRYPSQGKRSDHGDVPSRPTLARYAAEEAIDEEVFTSPINSETRTVLAALLKLTTGTDDTVQETVASYDTSDELQADAEEAVLNRYASAEDAGFALTGSVNHSAAAIAAVAAVSHGIDPIEAVRNHLDGETKYKVFGSTDDEESDE